MSRAELSTQQLHEMVQEMSGYDGSFEELNAYENDEEFFNTFFSDNPIEAVRATYFGDYSFSDDYVRFNGYGNLESLNDYDYEEELEDYRDEIVDRWVEMVVDGDIDNWLDELEGEIEVAEEEEII